MIFINHSSSHVRKFIKRYDEGAKFYLIFRTYNFIAKLVTVVYMFSTHTLCIIKYNSVTFSGIQPDTSTIHTLSFNASLSGLGDRVCGTLFMITSVTPNTTTTTERRISNNIMAKPVTVICMGGEHLLFMRLLVFFKYD